MNIAIITTSYTKGGAGRVASDLGDELRAQGHSVSVFTAGGGNAAENVFQIPRPNIFARLMQKISGNDLEGYPSDSILTHPAFKAADIVHCHNLHGNYFSLSTLKKIDAKKPIVWTLHDMWAITPHCPYSSSDVPDSVGFYQCDDLTPARTTSLEKKKAAIYANINPALVSPSLWLKDKVGKSVMGTKRSEHIVNGIDTDVFVPTDKTGARRKLNLPLDKKIVMFLSAGGKGDTRKGWEYAARVEEHYCDDSSVYFLSIGGGIAAERAGSKDVAYVNDEHLLAQYYSAADVFLFTSLRENFPLAVLEAMSCGTPVVSFDVGGVAEAVEHKKHGYIASFKDSGDLLKGIAYIFSLPAEARQTLAADARTRVLERYTLATMTNAYLALYQNLLSRK